MSKNDVAEFLAEAARTPDLQAKMKSVQTVPDLLAVAKQAGYDLDGHGISVAMREIAAKALQPHGLPHWAIESMFLGEAVCW